MTKDETGLDQQPSRYRHACQLASVGRLGEARQLLQELTAQAADSKQRALLCNDLAALQALAGDAEAARRGFHDALALDSECQPASANLALLDVDTQGVSPAAPTHRAGASSRAVKVALLSFLYNWPTAGGGNVHTAELAVFLTRAGYEVRHFYARYEPWGIGLVENPLFACEAVEFDPSTWNVREIRARFRQRVDSFQPDYVIVTDSWNIKPHLADAVRGYPYILRFQAMECICPLNNVRLLHDGQGRFQQCPRHQLANPQECARCVQDRGRFSGDLHRMERELSGVGTPEYHELLMRTMRDAEAVLVVNPLHEAMLSPYARCVRVVTAGMDTARFPHPEKQPASDRAVILFAGVVADLIKGYKVLHEACAMLWQRRQDFELVATGEPPGQVDVFTRFVGWQSQADLPRHLHEAAVVVMPSIVQEALGRTAVEAMAAGRPVIASRLGGLPFTVVDGATGLLCEPGNPVDLARQIETLLNDPELRRRLGEAGRRRFEEHFAWEGIIERHYKPLLGPPRRGTSNGYVAHIPERVDQARLLDEVGQFFRLPAAEVEARFQTYRGVHEANAYARTMGELKTLCFEEAFVLGVVLAQWRPRTIVEIGPPDGKATRRILDLKALLGLESRVGCFGVGGAVENFPRDEADLVLANPTGRIANQVLGILPTPGLIYLDAHAHALLQEAIAAILTDPGNWVLAIHDCAPGLCNPRMTLDKGAAVTSATGVWERHVLAEAFGLDDPLSERLNDCETATHRLRIFGTPHGLAVIFPK